MAKNKQKKWAKPRHRFYTAILRPIIKVLIKIRYNAKCERFKEQGKRKYVVLMNHQTAFDQFFIASSFKGPLYYLASEDLFSKGFVSKIINYLVAPIPIKKQSTDVRAVMNVLRVAKEGNSIALAPEGNRTFSGRTVYINPAIVGLVQKLKLPIAFYRIEGGFGIQPRWAHKLRKGKMRAYVSKVLEPEDYVNLSKEELGRIIEKELFVDETKISGIYKSSRPAEYVERAMYVCPYCGLSEFRSEKKVVQCLKCGKQIEYLPDKSLKGVGFEFAYKYLADWYDYQDDYVCKLNLSEYVDTPMYVDEARLSRVVVYKHKKNISKNTKIELYGDKIVLKYNNLDEIMAFDDITALTVLGKNKVNIYYDNNIYQLKGDVRFNGLKYVNIYQHYVNDKKGDSKDVRFLGI
jgi:1-acyl-sn-glycerol-3-phosphate acyltransferase